MIRAVSFDVDQTLVDFRTAMRGALETVLDQLPGWTADALQQLRNEVAAELGSGARLEQIRVEAFRRAGAPPEVAERYLEERFARLRVYDDVVPALEALQGRYRLGVASNGNSYVERVSLGRFFSFRVFAHDHGVRKPEPAFYARVVEAAGCRPEEVLHVGDDPEGDVAAARAAGLHALHLDRGGRGDVRSLLEVATLPPLSDPR